MQKRQELNNPYSCFNKAHPAEFIFVLLARDDAAAATIRFWIDERLRLGLNKRTDKQIIGAEYAADCFDAWHHEKIMDREKKLLNEIQKLIAESVEKMHAAAKRLEESEMFALPKHEAAAIYRSIAKSIDNVAQHIDAIAADMKTKIGELETRFAEITRQIPHDEPSTPPPPPPAAETETSA